MFPNKIFTEELLQPVVAELAMVILDSIVCK